MKLELTEREALSLRLHLKMGSSPTTIVGALVERLDALLDPGHEGCPNPEVGCGRGFDEGHLLRSGTLLDYITALRAKLNTDSSLVQSALEAWRAGYKIVPPPQPPPQGYKIVRLVRR